MANLVPAIDLAVLAASLPAGWLLRVFARWQIEGKVNISLILTIAGCVAVAAWSVAVMPADALLPVGCLLGWSLLALGIIDAIAFRLPDVLTLPLAAAGLLLSFFLPDAAPLNHLIGAAAGFFAFYGIAVLYARARGREGLGLGDAKLVAAAGAWLGWAALPYIVLIGCAGAFAWIGVSAMRRGKAALREQVPFGVPLCFALWLVWLYGPL